VIARILNGRDGTFLPDHATIITEDSFGVPAMGRTVPEFVLTVSSKDGAHRTTYGSLAALDDAFWEAVRVTPLTEQPVPWDSTTGQISAETYNVEGFG
jgi:hypothetical protein